ncbi:MAG: transposase [Candidatus Aegiribacteria sp.]|nr:transposase [Candidatus Aegiribacteria sp.]
MNEVQLITCAISQTASDSDTQVIEQVCEALKESGHLPERMLADTLYGSDDNVQKSAEYGVDLISPVSGKTPKTGKTRTEMSAEHCFSCKFRKDCPVRKVKRGYRLDHTSKQRRLDKRRKNEKTDEFRNVYSKRAGIESTNSGIKRRTGMSRLRVRGKGSVYQAMILRMAGWNILQAATTRKSREYVRSEMSKITQLITSAVEGDLRTLAAKLFNWFRFIHNIRLKHNWVIDRQFCQAV